MIPSLRTFFILFSLPKEEGIVDLSLEKLIFSSKMLDEAISNETIRCIIDLKKNCLQSFSLLNEIISFLKLFIKFTKEPMLIKLVANNHKIKNVSYNVKNTNHHGTEVDLFIQKNNFFYINKSTSVPWWLGFLAL